MTDQQLSKPFWYLVHENDGEPLAQYIEHGGDLANITDCDREVLARIVRGKSPRKRGQKLEKGLAERDWQLCFEVAILKSCRLPANMDACSVVAKRRYVSEGTVRHAWLKRDSFIKHIEEMYKHADKADRLPDESARKQYIDRTKNAWKDNG